MNLNDLQQHYKQHQEEIDARIEDFRELREMSDYRLFLELVFVILSSRSSARDAWKATEKLDDLDYVLNGEADEIAEILLKHDISFENNKADYIVENRKMLKQPTLANPTNELKLREKIDPDDVQKSREWLVDNIKGLGWKGASHFLRNIGHGEELGIVSTHIMTLLNELGTVESSQPPSSKEEYLEIENNMKKISEETSISLQALDLVLWSMKTGEVFK